MRKLIFTILLISFLGLYYYATDYALVSKVNQAGKNRDNKFFFLQQAVLDIKDRIKSTTPLSGKPSNPPNPTETLSEYTSVELKKWVEIEARAINMTNNNTAEKQIKMRAQAQTLNFQQLEILQNLATDTKLPINDRILSAYLISLNTSTQSEDSLFNVAKTEVPDFGPIAPHTEAELKHTQELAIRYMQIDELFHRAQTDANALDKLRLLATEAQYAQVRSYAEKKLKELK